MQARKVHPAGSTIQFQFRSPLLVQSTIQSDRNVRDFLAEAYRLLEAYAPTWYSENLSKRLAAAFGRHA
jgi:hypothetical protein